MLRIWILRNHTAAVTSVSFSEDSKNLVSSGYDDKITVWSMMSRTRSLDFITQKVRKYKIGVYLDTEKRDFV